MRTTKYDWICFARTFQTGGEYDPDTGGVTPFEYFRQELWVKALFRAARDGNTNAITQQEVSGGFVYVYTNLNEGRLYVRQIPTWPQASFTKADGSIFTPVITSNTKVFVYWSSPTVAFDTAEVFTNEVWVPIIGVADTAIGTRFSKHYEVKIASNIQGFNLIQPEVGGPPATTPPSVTDFEQAEARLNTVIQIGDGIVNP